MKINQAKKLTAVQNDVENLVIEVGHFEVDFVQMFVHEIDEWLKYNTMIKLARNQKRVNLQHDL